MTRAELWSILKETYADWSEDNASRLAAALAYYSLLSLAPMVMISIAVAAWFFGDDAARGHVARELVDVVGRPAADGINAVVESARAPETGVVSTVIGVVTLFLGASGVFGELQAAMNAIWEVAPKPGRGLWGELKARFASFTMVLGVAFLLLVSLVLSSLLSAMGAVFAASLPGGEALWQLLNFCLSFGVITGLFALIFKYVPDVIVEWRDVWLGAAVTALLFTLGKLALGLYLGKAAVGSAYGAAGSLIALVVWVYYAAQIMLLGAEFTQVQARHRGHAIKPDDDAIDLDADALHGPTLGPRHPEKIAR